MCRHYVQALCKHYAGTMQALLEAPWQHSGGSFCIVSFLPALYFRRLRLLCPLPLRLRRTRRRVPRTLLHRFFPLRCRLMDHCEHRRLHHRLRRACRRVRRACRHRRHPLPLRLPLLGRPLALLVVLFAAAVLRFAVVISFVFFAAVLWVALAIHVFGVVELVVVFVMLVIVLVIFLFFAFFLVVFVVLVVVFVIVVFFAV